MFKIIAFFISLFQFTSIVNAQNHINLCFSNELNDINNPSFIIYKTEGKNQPKVSNLNPERNEWTALEISEADVARENIEITDFEKDVILYHNLVRMYPRKYLQIEILNFKEDVETKDKIKFPFSWRGTDTNSHYYKSLISTLSTQTPLPKLIFDHGLSIAAKCLAREQSLNGNIGHDRISCNKIYSDKSNKNVGYGVGENCGYGKYNGKDLVNQLLIDEDVPSLGHRNNILNKSFTKIGAGVDFHPKYETVVVIDYLYEVLY